MTILGDLSHLSQTVNESLSFLSVSNTLFPNQHVNMFKASSIIMINDQTCSLLHKGKTTVLTFPAALPSRTMPTLNPDIFQRPKMLLLLVHTTCQLLNSQELTGFCSRTACCSPCSPPLAEATLHTCSVDQSAAAPPPIS